MKWVFLLVIFLGLTQPILAGSKAKEVAEYVLSKVSKEAVKEGVVTLTNKIEGLAAKHGPEVYEAVKKSGVGTIHLLEQAEAHGKPATRLLARFGDEAIVLVARPQTLALVARHGDNAALVLLKHKGIAEPIIERFGQPAVQALAQLNPQNGRRLAMLLEEKALAKSGRIEEVIGVIGKFGDRAMTFVWENKGALTITAVLTAFLSNPEAFINGASGITKIAGETVVRTIAEVPVKVAVEVAKGVNWPPLFLPFLLLLGLLWVLHMIRNYKH